MEERVNWWKNPSYWPIDRSGDYVSLFETTLTVGKAIFQEDWTCAEPYAQPLTNVIAKQPSWFDWNIKAFSSSHLDMKELYELLRTHRPDINLIEPKFSYALNRPCVLTTEQREIVAEIGFNLDVKAYADEVSRIEHHNSLALPAKDRMDMVIDTIAGAVCRGELAWALSTNGHFEPMHSIKEWRSGPIRQRFVCGVMNINAPFSSLIGPDECADIFFSKQDLKRLVATYSSTVVAREKSNKVDRTVKANVPAKKLQAWAGQYFSEFEGKKAPTHARAEAAYRQAFPDAGTTQFRNEVWPNRPLWMKTPRAPKGA